jgi:hypothetical protein
MLIRGHELVKGVCCVLALVGALVAPRWCKQPATPRLRKHVPARDGRLPARLAAASCRLIPAGCLCALCDLCQDEAIIRWRCPSVLVAGSYLATKSIATGHLLGPNNT